MQKINQTKRKHLKKNPNLDCLKILSLFRKLPRAKGVLCCFLLFTTIFSLGIKAEEIVLYEAGKGNKYNFKCSTCSWIKSSNTKPIKKIVERNGKKWLQIVMTGNKGKGRIVMNLKRSFSSLVPENMIPKGLEVIIDYPKNDFRKFRIPVYFNDGKSFTKKLSLEQGLKTYYFDRGYSRAGIPQNWRNLSSIAFFIPAGFPKFYLKKIAVKLHREQVTEKNVKIQRIRKVCEVLPGKNNTSLDFGVDSPFQVKIGYDRHNLYINSEAEYPAQPTALLKPGNKFGSIWGDELTEYFFSGWNDNLKYIQFASNLIGATWNSITDYDMTAATVIRKVHNWQLKHDKKMSWKNGKWKNEATFPFSALRFDVSKQRFMGFQIAQGYEKSRGGKYTTTIWDKCQKLPKPANFGMLVFNRKPFGPGKIAVPKNVLLRQTKNSEKVDFLLKVSLSGFTPGNYKLHRYVAVPSEALAALPVETVVIKNTSQVLNIKYNGCKNLNGIYSLYAALENANGDMRLCAVNFDNSKPLVDMFGKPLFCPMPKKVAWKQGVFDVGKNNTLSISDNASVRTLKTAKIFAEKLLGYAGKYRIKRGANSGIVLQIASTAVFNSKMKKLKLEGYCLRVTPDKVIITGADEPGLYYGCRTFMQMLRQPMKRLDSAPVRCAEILDWPDMKKRFTNLMHSWQFYKRGFKERRDINYLIDWVDKYVAGTKQNMFITEISSLVKYKRHPELNAAQCLYSLDDIKKLSQYCRDNFIEFVPRWQTGGHSDFWLTKCHPELREKGYRNQADVTNPEYTKILFDCMLDVIDASQCRYINIAGDEWWHRPQPKEKPDKLLHGRTRAQAFLDFHKAVVEFAKKNNVEVMMHEDMLDPYHNGTRYDIYKIIDKMPKDIIILPWSGGNADRMIMYFINKGFRVWANPTGFWFPDRSRKQIGGCGKTVYSFFFTNSIKKKMKPNEAMAILRYSEYAWNAYSDKLATIVDQVSSGILPALMEQFAVPWNPAASQTVVPIAVKQAFNTDFNKLLLRKEPEIYAGKTQSVKLPAGEIDAGNIPMKLGTGKLNCIRIGQGADISLAVNAKYASLIFLHTVRKENKQFFQDNYRQLLWRRWPYGRPAGDYIVKYTDGSSVKIPIRLRDNIYFENINPLYSSCLNCRYIMPVKDVNGNYLFLYQYEWVNPFSGKTIKSVALTQSVVDFDLLLFALSGRKVK